MKILVLVTILMAFAVCAFAQEQPEPTAPPILYQHFQIMWGPQDTGVWEDITPVAVTVVDIPAEGIPTIPTDADHDYWKVGTGPLSFISEAAESTAANPRVVVFALDPAIPPGSPWTWFWFLRTRLAPSADENGIIKVGDWSVPSYWVGLIRLPFMPVAIHLLLEPA